MKLFKLPQAAKRLGLARFLKRRGREHEPYGSGLTDQLRATNTFGLHQLLRHGPTIRGLISLMELLAHSGFGAAPITCSRLSRGGGTPTDFTGRTHRSGMDGSAAVLDAPFRILGITGSSLGPPDA